MLLVNLALFFVIVKKLHNAAEKRRTSSYYASSEEISSHRRELRAIVSISSMMGLAWIFGLFISTADGNGSLFLQYCFAVFATLQGFFIFIFHVLLSPQAKSETASTLLRSSSQSTSGRTGLPHRLSYRAKVHTISGNDYSTAGAENSTIPSSSMFDTTAHNNSSTGPFQESTLVTLDSGTLPAKTTLTREPSKRVYMFE